MFAPAASGFADPGAGLGSPAFAQGYSPDGGMAPMGYGAPDGGLSPQMAGGYSTPPMGYGAPPPLGGGGGTPPNPTSLPFAPQELEYYQQLFGIADPDGRGVIEGLACANFLYGSGLPQDILRLVWDISDRHKQGFLNAEGFYVALRLVAHAQAGHVPDPQLVTVEPPALPDFPGLQRRREPSEVSPPPGSATPSVCGGATSEISELQPVIAGEDQVRRAANAAARQASRSASPKPFTRERWAPSRRERRKYASLFKRTDWDGDGYVQGGEVQALLERSHLSREQLMVAWEHADRDQDGRLDFREFVCLVHVVTCVLRGAQQPGPAEELPVELTSALMSLEPLDVLVSEREASRSRSASPMPSLRDSPEFPPHSPRERGRSKETRQLFEEGGSAAAAGLPAPDAGPSSGANADPFGFEAQGGALGSDSFGAFDAPPGDSQRDKSKKDKKEKGRRKKGAGGLGDDQDDPSPPLGTDVAFGALDGGSGFGDFGNLQDPFTTTEQPGVADFGGRRAELADEPGLTPHSRKHLDAAVSQFEAMSSADQQVSRQLRREVDELDAELHQSQDAHAQLERQVQLEQEECDRLEAERRRLEGMVRQARQRFAGLQDERRSANLESLSLRRDRGHFAEETAFLRRMAADEEATLEVLRTANQFLERSQHELEAQTEVLERERRDLLKMASKEKELVHQAERQNAELRNRLERIRRERSAAAVERQEANLREERVRDMQSHGAQPRTTPDGRPLEPTPSSGKHTWAPGLLGGAAGGPAAAAKLGGSASAGPGGFPTAPPRVALSREGV